MLNSDVIKKIEDFVYAKPRSVQEIAEHIGKNWRTADRYIDEIKDNLGVISTRVFREGTRGALKIVYWSAIEKVSSSVFQEALEQAVMAGRKKEDFPAFDIYQHVGSKNKKVSLEEVKTENETDLKEFADMLASTKKQLLILSGNLSFINLKNKEADIFRILESLVRKGVSMKIVSRVDMGGKENIEKILSLNFKHGKERIEVRHREQPLRAIISDNNVFRIKQVIEPTGKPKELSKMIYIFYTIKDKEWTGWLTRIFWKMFNSSIGSDKRMQELKRL